MKLQPMQDNEPIPDAFIRQQLDAFIPSEGLLQTSYSRFLTERPPKKRRRFFGLFFSFLLAVSLTVYYYFTTVHPANSRSASLRLTRIQQQPRHPIIQAPSVKNIFVYDSIFFPQKNKSLLDSTIVREPGIDTNAAITIKRTALVNINTDSLLKMKVTAPADTFYIVW